MIGNNAAGASAFMAQVARDAMILEAQLISESNRNGWAAPAREERSTPPVAARPVPTPAAFKFPNVGPRGAAAFAPVTGSHGFRRDLDSLLLHESAHACVARALGLGVIDIIISVPDAAGRVSARALIGAGSDNSYLMPVAAAAGLTLDLMVWGDARHGPGDSVLVHVHRSDYERRCGRPYPCDPFAVARSILTRPEVKAAVNRVAGRLGYGTTMHAQELESIVTGS